MTIQWHQNCPIFQLPVETLMPTPHPILHRLVLGPIQCAPWTLHFLGCLPNVSIVHLHPFVLIQPMRQATTKNFDVWILTSSIRFINPHAVPCKNIHPNLVPRSTFPFKLEQKKSFLGCLDPAVGCVHQCHLHWWGSCSDCHYLSYFQKQSRGNKVSLIQKIS